MVFQIKSYIKFLWKSTNSHGVHSPFVFDLVTKCFYDKTDYTEYKLLKKSRNAIEISDLGLDTEDLLSGFAAQASKKTFLSGKNAQLLFRIVRYFQPANVLLLGNPLGFATENTMAKYFDRLLATVTNDTIWIFSDIHTSALGERSWEMIKKHSKITVTIDTFNYGIVLFRREQQKEDFIIRPLKSNILDCIMGIRKLWGLLP